MQRSHRTVHRLVWILILVAALTTFVVSIQVRPDHSTTTEVR